MRRSPTMTDESELSRIIAALMTAGIAAGVFFELVGMALYYHAHGHLHVSMDREVFIHGQSVVFLVYDIARAAGRQGVDISFLALGIVVLMVTPFLRVIISVVYFALRRDYRYVCITLIVLIILTLSLILHGSIF